MRLSVTEELRGENRYGKILNKTNCIYLTAAGLIGLNELLAPVSDPPNPDRDDMCVSIKGCTGLSKEGVRSVWEKHAWTEFVNVDGSMRE
jgi:hypothetical protein